MRDLLKLQLPEIQKQELKKKKTHTKTQTQLVAVKNMLDAHFHGKVNRCSFSNF